ncbi:arylamine N-acetyltransferase [Streptomyces sodiiphilus]|uniref:Arylamine N-acetyltransferase n=1 Tax=Streptomyces sodiiphilus TaxID=226217 RepID=A0ABN2PQV4_9ACTN
MNDAWLPAYLDRIGAPRPAVADASALAALQEAHLRAVPFENLAIHLGEEIELTEEALVDKVVRRGRGGFCYELNGAFGILLGALGYRVTPLAARDWSSGVPGIPFDHLALRVETADGTGPWLADVGFGRFISRPVLLESRDPQADPAGTVLLKDAAEGDLDVLLNGTHQYRLELRPRTLADFEVGCWYHRTSPRSHFARSLVCSRPVPGGRVTLSGRTLKISRDGAAGSGPGERVTELADEAEVLAAYREHFGVVLDREPVVRGG